MFRSFGQINCLTLLNHLKIQICLSHYKTKGKPRSFISKIHFSKTFRSTSFDHHQIKQINLKIYYYFLFSSDYVRLMIEIKHRQRQYYTYSKPPYKNVFSELYVINDSHQQYFLEEWFCLIVRKNRSKS